MSSSSSKTDEVVTGADESTMKVSRNGDSNTTSIDLSLLLDRSENDDVVKRLSKMIIQCLQVRGALSLDKLSMILLAKKEDVQSVLDCLVTTPLIKMKRVGEQTLYQYRDGHPQSDRSGRKSGVGGRQVIAYRFDECVWCAAGIDERDQFRCFGGFEQ